MAYHPMMPASVYLFDGVDDQPIAIARMADSEQRTRRVARRHSWRYPRGFAQIAWAGGHVSTYVRGRHMRSDDVYRELRRGRRLGAMA